MLRLFLLLLFSCSVASNFGFGQQLTKKRYKQLYVTVDKEVKPYVWGGDSHSLYIDTLVFKDSVLKHLLYKNIVPDYNTVKGRVLYGELYYNIQIDTLDGMTLLKCYHPHNMAHDFYEYTKRLITKSDVYFNNMADVFGYIVINNVPLLISGNAAGEYFKKIKTVQMPNPYPANAVIYDNSGIRETIDTLGLFDSGPDDFIIASYLYIDGALEDYSAYSRKVEKTFITK